MARRITGTMTVVGLVSMTLLGFVKVASAHEPELIATCVEDVATLSVSLSEYNDKKPNKIVVTDNGKILDKSDFGTSYSKKWNSLDGTIAHKFVIDVTAWDDLDGKDGWTFRKEVDLAKCVKTPPTTTTTTTVPTTITSTTPSKPAPTTTTTTVAPVPPKEQAAPPLANTGAATTWLLLSGLVLVGAGAGVLLFLRRKQA
ncbi:LPXTG cell wall anchor domain-containing protein [Lentzea jiangxiensis]|uniref:LPXTG-motif cell wall anchor domain-containing protein n=1 Tax=Lentzea jiangxiensis TaxID=641025 RepID=A0A1H0X3I9_9PSEU|nr:LPXTG cell wall anchor domain-containing protein [Lentzea jiangxiensis]SDP97409.1 LPXTG-motif cell wall anchor domain-containing protein [Lentzea jiangxiensis]